jgi:hypothetical protein
MHQYFIGLERATGMGLASESLYFALYPNQLRMIVQWWVSTPDPEFLHAVWLAKLADQCSLFVVGNCGIVLSTSETKSTNLRQPRPASSS